MKSILLLFMLCVSISSKSQSDYFGMVQVDTNLWVDKTEITNKEYRCFINWVRDSIARKILFDAGFNEYSKNNLLDTIFIPNGKITLNFNDSIVKKVLLKSKKLFYSESERFYNKLEVNSSKLNYVYNNDIGEKVIVNIYPDTSKMCLYINYEGDTLVNFDFYGFSLVQSSLVYFYHPAFDNFPVVNITYDQAKAFCFWRTKSHNDWLDEKKSSAPRVKFALPSLKQWNYISDHSKLSLKTYNNRSREDSILSIEEYYNLRKVKVYFGGNQSLNFYGITSSNDEDAKYFSKKIKSYYYNRFKYLKGKKRNSMPPHFIVSSDTYPFEKNTNYFLFDYSYSLPVDVENQFGFTPGFYTKKNQRIFGFAGNVAEMTSEGYVIGGSFHHPLKFCLRGTTITHNPNAPERWLGFRCILKQLPKKY